MKRLFVVLILLSLPVICHAAWVAGPVVESGKQLPDELSCLSYRGRNASVIALYAEACPDITDGWLYVPKDPDSGRFVWLHNNTLYRFTPLSGAVIQVERKE